MKNLFSINNYKDTRWLILILGVCLAYFSVGFHHPDEHFSVLELMNWKKGGISWDHFNWDVQSHMRPFFLPSVLYLLSNTLDLFQLTNPFIQAFIFRLLAILLGYYAFSRFIKDRFSLLFSLSIWFVPYIFARVSSESISASLFFIALSLREHKSPIKDIVIGLLLGLSFNTRFQMGISFIGLYLWFIVVDKRTLKSIATISFGLLISLIIGVLIDRWAYGLWTLTPWNYLKVNLIENKVNTFGTSPFYFYITKNILKGIPPISLLLIFSSFYYFLKKPKDILSFCLIPFILVHSLIGHKEIRFLFLVYLCSPIFLLYLKREYLDKNSWSQVLWKVAYIINLAALVKILFTPAYRPLGAYEFLYQNVQKEQALITPIQGDQRHLNLEMVFYLKKGIQLSAQSWEQINLLSSQKKDFWLVTSKYKERSKTPDNCHISYSLYPNWLLSFNFFRWRDRSAIWTIYRCDD